MDRYHVTIGMIAIFFSFFIKKRARLNSAGWAWIETKSIVLYVDYSKEVGKENLGW